MIVPTHARKDQSVATITVRLDNKNTTDLKKFHCVICGYILFAYYDSLQIMVPGEENPDEYIKLKNAVEEIECQQRRRMSNGKYDRCRTFYILNRG
jgi:hypothetical protein